MNTREKLNCAVFGAPKPLYESILPTFDDVMKLYLWIKHEIKSKKPVKEPSFKEIATDVVVEVEKLWQKASIPTVSHTRVLQMLRCYHDKYRALIKNYRQRKDKTSLTAKIQAFQHDAKSKLFDISACKCVDFQKCVCPKNRKVPEEERGFLLDQRSQRKMIIGAVDVITSKKNEQKYQRQVQRVSRLTKRKITKPIIASRLTSDTESDSLPSSSVESEEFMPSPENKKKRILTPNIKNRMTMPLSKLALACDRTGVSDRSAASIASAVLQDVGIIHKEDTTKVIDRMKVRRQREKNRKKLQKRDMENTELLQGLYFDGRKDVTIKIEKKAEKSYRKTVKEEHYSLIQEPGSIYIGHVTPSSGTAKSVSTSIIAHLENNNFDCSELAVVGCDGTVVNTGHKNGVITKIESFLGRPVQWLICQLHANELPLRHLFQHLDGSTTGPREFSGSIGKKLIGCENLPVAAFHPIVTEMPVIDKEDLSTDQKYLLEICNAVASGVCSESLSLRDPGRISHSRWLTAANRILRLYVGTEKPSRNLEILAEYIVKVYAPVWFDIKCHPSCKDGAKHVLKTIHASRYLNEDLKAVIDPVIQRNSYFAHPENILLAMISDERKHIRELGLRKILGARASTQESRTFVIPPLNFEALEYENLICWQSCTVTEPPLTFSVTQKDLEDLINSGETNLTFPKFPCHTQAVERCVKLVTEASAAVCGNVKRDGFIRSRLESRKIMPRFETKVDYVV